jgi:hypothetical protein
MSSIGAAPRAAVSLSPARAAASRRNGAKSRGPKTPAGKARSAQNALKHGLRAQKHIVLPGERATEFAALEAALLEELAPQGALQTVLARRVVAAAWRLERAERLEADLFVWNLLGGGGRNLGLALIRECNNARAFDTLLRYRGGTLAEFWRALRTLKALQAEQAARPESTAAPRLIAQPHETPIEPETRKNPRDSARPGDPADRGKPAPGPAPARLRHRPPARVGESASCAQPIEPERREQRAKAAPPSLLPEKVEGGGSGGSLLAGTALVPLGLKLFAQCFRASPSSSAQVPIQPESRCGQPMKSATIALNFS